jgi:hypothetical protein
MKVERTPFLGFGIVSLIISGLLVAIGSTSPPPLLSWFSNVLLVFGVVSIGVGLVRSVLDERDDGS